MQFAHKYLCTYISAAVNYFFFFFFSFSSLAQDIHPIISHESILLSAPNYIGYTTRWNNNQTHYMYIIEQQYYVWCIHNDDIRIIKYG